FILRYDRTPSAAASAAAAHADRVSARRRHGGLLATARGLSHHGGAGREGGDASRQGDAHLREQFARHASADVRAAAAQRLSTRVSVERGGRARGTRAIPEARGAEL